MSDNRKYYYLKLKENYFDEDAIVLLESMQDGILYSNILLKLYLKSLKNGGKLQLDENIPYTAQMIATITRQQVGTVERALQIFMKLGLVEPLQNGALYMSNIELLIGQSSTEGERKRRARLALQEQKALPKAGADKCPPYQADICPPEIEIEKEIEKERERELDTGQPARAAYGRYENVFLSQSELDGLKADLPGKWDYYIDRLSCHIASSGKRYKSHAATEQLAVFSEVYYEPDWRAYIDGKPADYMRADYILRAMVIPAGDHVIEFKNEAPLYFKMNIVTIVSSIVLVVLAGGAIFMYYRKRKKA